jgi:CRP-like cAMP-binding protein
MNAPIIESVVLPRAGAVEPDDLQHMSRLGLVPADDPVTIDAVCGLALKRHYRRGEVIYRQDDAPGALHQVLNGLVRIEIESRMGRTVIISWIGRGSLFGLIGFVTGELQGETAVAVEETTILSFEREPMLRAIESRTDTLQALTTQLARRWQHARELLQDVVFLDVPGRMAKLLLHLSTRADLQLDGTHDMFRLPSQAELALHVGSTRVTVNKWLKVFAQQGWIEHRRGGIRVLDQEKLRSRIA